MADGMSRFYRAVLLATALIAGLAASLCGFLFHALYWRYRDLFNEQGRYFNANETVVYDDSAFVFIFPAIVLGAVAVWAARRWWNLR